MCTHVLKLVSFISYTFPLFILSPEVCRRPYKRLLLEPSSEGCEVSRYLVLTNHSNIIATKQLAR